MVALFSVAKALCGPLASALTLLKPLVVTMGKDFIWLGNALAGDFALALTKLKPLFESMRKTAISLGKSLGGVFMKAISGILMLGQALLTTPVGWVILAIAAVAGAAYLIYKNWSKISVWLEQLWAPVADFFRDLWSDVSGVFTEAWDAISGYIGGKIKGITDAFDKGFLQGMMEVFLAFSPLTWIMDAMDAMTKHFFGFSLKDAGSNIVNSLLDGLKAAWDGVVTWLSEAWDSLTGWLPDVMREKLGMTVDASTFNAPGSGAPAMAVSHGPTQFGQGPATGLTTGVTTGAASVMAGGAVGCPFGWGRLPEQNVRTEVVITGANLPPGFTVSTPKSQADNTRIDCGYMMQWVY